MFVSWVVHDNGMSSHNGTGHSLALILRAMLE